MSLKPRCQRHFMRGFRFRSILYSERCAHICLAPYFLVMCPRLDLSDGITAPGCAWMSSEETVVVLIQQVVGCLHTYVAKTSILSFRRVGTALSGYFPQARTVLLFGSYFGQIIPRQTWYFRRRK